MRLKHQSSQSKKLYHQASNTTTKSHQSLSKSLNQLSPGAITFSSINQSTPNYQDVETQNESPYFQISQSNVKEIAHKSDQEKEGQNITGQHKEKIFGQNQKNMICFEETEKMDLEQFKEFKQSLLKQLKEVEERVIQKNTIKPSQSHEELKELTGIVCKATGYESLNISPSLKKDENFQQISQKQHALYQQIEQEFQQLFNSQVRDQVFPVFHSSHNYQAGVLQLRDKITQVENQIYQSELSNKELSQLISDKNFQIEVQQASDLSQNDVQSSLINQQELSQYNNQAFHYQNELSNLTSLQKSRRHRNPARMIQRHFGCTYEGCNKEYGTEGSLNMHIKLKHPGYKYISLTARKNRQMIGDIRQQEKSLQYESKILENGGNLNNDTNSEK
eukprot:403374776